METFRRAMSATDVCTLDMDPFSREFLTNPYAYHPTLRDAGPVVYLPQYDVFGMARHKNVAAVLKDWSSFTSERGVGLSDFAREAPWRPKSLLLETDPPAHDVARGIANKIISLASLKPLRVAWAKAASDMVGRLVALRSFDGIKDLAECYPTTVFADVIGLRDDGRDCLIPYATANFNAFGPHNDIFQSTEPARLAASDWIEESCTRAFIKPGSWGAAFFAAADRGECSEAQASRLVRSMITAGFDTTINAIGAMLYSLVDNDRAWTRLRADRSLVRRAIEEALRLNSPVQTFFRTTTKAVDIDGVTIPEGRKVLLFLGSANRDPRRWQEPDTFDLDRQTSGHVAFGFGVHQCLGQMVARQEAEMILGAVLDQVAALRSAGQPIRRPNNTLYALSGLPLHTQPI